MTNVTKKRLITPLTPELYCSNIKTSLLFYIDILGFSIKYQREEDKFAMLERQGSRIMLEQIPDDPTDRAWVRGSLEHPFGRGINLQIMTDEVDKLYEHVQKSRALIFLPIEIKWYRANDIELGNQQFIVLDPDGYMLRFFQNLGERKAELY